MARKNPVNAPIQRKALHESVVNPVGSSDNTGSAIPTKKGTLPVKPKKGMK